MTGFTTVVIFISVFSSTFCALTDNIKPRASEGDYISLNRVKRSAPIIYDIYTLDHFVELVEKIERHTITSGDTLKQIVNYIRLLGYNTDLFNKLCGQADPLPGGVLNSEEIRVLTNMVSHSFDSSSKREKGVVLTPDGETIAMGRVITGICAGLVRDNLYSATIANDLAVSALFNANSGGSNLLGPTGGWSPKADCPEKYLLTQGSVSKATDAQILGGIDGLLLGYGVPDWKNKGVRLGQLLRMYYGSGILYDTSYARCQRKTKFEQLVDGEVLNGQIEAFANAYYDKHSSQLTKIQKKDIPNIAKDIKDKFYVKFGKIAGNTSCSTDENKEDCEIPANIVFVMDESGSIGYRNYQKEKKFVREMIQTFDISPVQARVAIVEFSSSPTLSVALNNYGSKTRLMCAVSEFYFSGGGTGTAGALKMVHETVLRPAIDKPVSSTETVQIVVVLTDGQSNSPRDTALEAKNLKNDIPDLTVIAVGVGLYQLSELKSIATNNETHVFTAINFDKLLEMVTSLRRKACTAPVYMGLNFTNTDDTTEVVAFVSPNKARFFTLSAEHFFGVENIYIDVIPQYGSVTVYASRITDTPGPDNYTQKFGPTGEGDNIQIEFSNLCAGYSSAETCPSINIGIYGETSSLKCSEKDCNLPNQIKFRIRRGTPASSGDLTTGGHFILHFVLFVIVMAFSL